MVVLLFVYALSLSIVVPGWFLLAGPVRERRALLGLTYAALFVLAWSAALVLGFLSPVALGAGVAAMVTLGAAAAWCSHRDERLLARFAAQIDDPATRAAALDELRARIREIGNEGERVIALMEIASFPIRLLVQRGLFDEAEELLELIDTELGPRLGRLDRAELRLLQARIALHRGHADDALRRVEQARADAKEPELDVLEALARSARGEAARADALLRRAALRGGSQDVADLAALARAHTCAARGDEAGAITALRSIRSRARASVLQLARALHGPATDLCARLAHPTSPYR